MYFVIIKSKRLIEKYRIFVSNINVKKRITCRAWAEHAYLTGQRMINKYDSSELITLGITSVLKAAGDVRVYF